MTRLATTPDVFRRTSRTTVTLAEAIAGARVLLRDAGYPDAEHLNGPSVTAAFHEIEAEAAAQGIPALDYLRGQAAARRAAITAATCVTCGAHRPQFMPSRGWGVLDNAAACPDCIAAAPGARSAA